MLLHGKRVYPVILNMNSMVGEFLLLLNSALTLCSMQRFYAHVSRNWSSLSRHHRFVYFVLRSGWRPWRLDN